MQGICKDKANMVDCLPEEVKRELITLRGKLIAMNRESHSAVKRINLILGIPTREN